MVENTIDDLVWSFTDDFTVLAHDLYMGFSCKVIETYSNKKMAEHQEFISKLKKIQDFIIDKELKRSIQPLIDHHDRLKKAYGRVYIFANAFRNISNHNT